MVHTLARSAQATMVAAAREAAPREACGLLLGRGSAIAQAMACRNVHPEPLSGFEIDPAALIAAHRAARQDGPQVLGYWHSHPNGLPRPSAIDDAMAAHDGRVWAIVTECALTLWLDQADGFVALPYAVHDG